nr:hypothetical protein [Tanacetum cinerariifolium]
MGDEHLNTILATELDEFIKSYVENLVPNPSESEGESECDMPACEEFTTFSNILFNEEIIPIKINQHHDNAESTHDSSLTISSKINSLLDEFAGELTLLKAIQPGIDKIDCYPEDEIRFTERLLYDNSSPRPPKEFISENSNAEIESLSPSPIPNEDIDFRMEEIDLTFTSDDPMPPGIEDDDDDSERDVLIHEELLDNYSLSLPVPMPRLMITLASNKEKSHDFLSYQGLEIFQLSSKCLMMIHGKNIPTPDVPLFHFYPHDQFKYGGELGQAQRPKTSASWEASHAYQ